MPFIRNVWTFAPHLIGILLSNFTAPFPNGFVSHLNPAIEHHFFNVSLAQWEGVVEPNTVADNFGREAMARIHEQNQTLKG
jgi:hypothetical protein